MKIKGFENYEIFEDGTITGYKGEKLKPIVKKTGYCEVYLYKDGKPHYKLLHRLVAETFLPKVIGKNEVNHIDGNKLNNSVSNLEWCNRNENLAHAYKTGLKKNNTVAKSILCIKIDTKERFVFSSIYQASKKLKISKGNICLCCKGIRPQASGFLFSYI